MLQTRRIILIKNMRFASTTTLGHSTSTETVKEKPKPYSEIPGPRGLPIIGVLPDYIRKDGFQFNKMFLAMEHRQREFGPIVKEKIANFEHVIISDPQEYLKVIRIDGRYPHRIEMEPLAHYRRKKGMILGTVSGQGKEWYRHRKVLSKKLLNPAEIREYIPPMNVAAENFIDRLAFLNGNQPAPIPDLQKELFKWAMESIGSVLFGTNISKTESADSFIQSLLDFFHYLQPLMYGPPLYKLYPTDTWRKFEASCNSVIGIAQGLVDKNVQLLNSKDTSQAGEIAHRNVMQYLLSEKSLSASEANSHAIDLMMGAVETTSTATLWVLHMLSQNPSAQDAAYKELRAIIKDKDDQITADTLSHMPYIKACLRETFRLYPITFATSRIIKEDVVLSGYHVPAGSHVQANLWGMGRDAKIFSKPEKFAPERFLTGTCPLSNLTFGHGARLCLGKRVAEQELYILLAKIILNYQVLATAENSSIQPVLHTVMVPDQPLSLVFKPRRQAE